MNMNKSLKIYFEKVFPSSFSIAALIGAAAIRKQVATKLGLNIEKEEHNIEKSEEDRKDGTKRRLSFDKREEYSVAEKKICVNEEESLPVTHPKLDFSFKASASPFLEQLRFAKCFFKDNQNLLQAKVTREERREDSGGESKDLITQNQNQKQIPRMTLASRQTSMSNDFKTQPSQNNNPNKQSIVNSNTKVLEKVIVYENILCYAVELSKFCHFHKKFASQILLWRNLMTLFSSV